MTSGHSIESPRRRARRWLATGLVAYGIAGIVLALAGLVALAQPLGALASLAGQRADAVRFLDIAVESLGEAERSSDGAAASLSAAEQTARSAGALLRDLAATMAGLRDVSGLTILGAQPLGVLRDDFGRVADRSTAVADETAKLAAALATERTNLQSLAVDAGRLRAEVSGFRAALAADTAIGWFPGIFGLVVLVVAWLTLPAAVSLVVGIRLLRSGGRAQPGLRAGDGRGTEKLPGAS
jgi:hypothetical protein